MTGRVLGGVLLFGAATVAAGLLLDTKDFAVSLLAGAAGASGGVLIAVLLVERLLQRERERQWASVSAQLRRSILGTISDVAFDFYLANVPSLPDGADPFGNTSPADSPSAVSAVVAALEFMADDIESRKQALGTVRAPTIVVRDENGVERLWQRGDPKSVHSVSSEQSARRIQEHEYHRSSSQSLYEDVKPYLQQLRDSMLPRLLQLGGRPPLAAALGDVEAAERVWRWAVELVEGDWGAPEEDAWAAAAQVARRLAEAARLT
jgi:hypothetical protein